VLTSNYNWCIQNPTSFVRKSCTESYGNSYTESDTYVWTAPKGLSTHVRICVRIAIRLGARFVRKQNRDPNFFLSLITIVCLQNSAKKNHKLTCLTPLAANRTPNRMGIRMGNRTCGQPLIQGIVFLVL
jgi:hypothetical protein